MLTNPTGMDAIFRYLPSINLTQYHCRIKPVEQRNFCEVRFTATEDFMSAFEIISVVLGAIPLVISALENYKAGKGAWYTLKEYHGKLDKLIGRLQTQRYCFHMHLRNLLKNAGVQDARQSSSLSEGECARILESAQTESKVVAYFGDMFEGFLQVLGRYQKILEEIVSELKSISRTPKVPNLPLKSRGTSFRLT